MRFRFVSMHRCQCRCVIYCFTRASELMDSLMRDGFRSATQCAQGGLLWPLLLFYNRRPSVAGALCHNVRTCGLLSIYSTFQQKIIEYRISGDGIGESLRTCCRVFDSGLALDLHHGPLIYQKSGARVSSSTSGFIEPLRSFTRR
jgi:hypothetical protein